jgi:hypothetical protein
MEPAADSGRGQVAAQVVPAVVNVSIYVHVSADVLHNDLSPDVGEAVGAGSDQVRGKRQR